MPWTGQGKCLLESKIQSRAYKSDCQLLCQLGPRYEGQLTRMAEPIPLPVNPPRTHSRLYHHPDLRTDGR